MGGFLQGNPLYDSANKRELREIDALRFVHGLFFYCFM